MSANEALNVVLTDFQQAEDWDFIKRLEKTTNEKWCGIGLTSNKNFGGGGVQTLIRYLKYFWCPFAIFINRKKYHRVLAWQQFYGLILAFYLSIFHCKKTIDLTVMTFIYKPKQGFVGRIYGSFMKRIVRSGYIDRYIVFSKNEVDYYSALFGVPREKFRFMLYGVDDEYEKYKNEIVQSETYLAAGRSNRDYEFLVKAWESADPQLDIICDTCQEREKQNVVILKDCHGDDYLKRIARCHAVIIPFADEKISAGQLVVLHAMMLGKPVICTKSDTIVDYIIPNETALMIEKNTDDLHKAIVQLTDKTIYKKLSENARKYFAENFSVEALGCGIGKIIVEK